MRNHRSTARGGSGAGLYAFGVFLILTAMALPAFGAQPVGRVTDLTGPATVLRDGEPTVLRRGAPIYATDTLRTLAASKLEVTFGDGTSLVLGAGALVEVETFVPAESEAAGHAVLSLAQGLLRILTGPESRYDAFDVRTANVVASARLTHWIVVVSDDGDDTGVFVMDGRVAVSAAGEEVTLQPGEGTDVFQTAAPTPPARWGRARIDKLLAATTL